jgi:hypothetical protein
MVNQEKSRHVNLFKEKKKTKKTVDDKVFDVMDEASSRQERHVALAMAGMVPGPAGMAADIADIALYAKEGDLKGMGWAFLAAIPILGQVAAAKKIWKAPRVLADIRLSAGKSFEHTVNKGIVDLGMKSKYKSLGKIKTKAGEYDISVTKDEIFLNKKRHIRVIKMKDKEQGITVFQPFYKSTGRGVPSIESKGKWFPFEGILPRKHTIDYYSWSKGGEPLKRRYIGKDMGWAFEQGIGEMPTGWFIKGFKSPRFPARIYSTGSRKSGLDIHKDIGKLIRKNE